MQQIFRNGWKIFSERRDAWITFSRESKQSLPPWFHGEGREWGGGQWCTLVRKHNCFPASPGFPTHIFPLMSGMEHPFLLWQLGYCTEKSKINGMLCEESLEQLDIAGHNGNGWSDGDIWFPSPRVLTMAERPIKIIP